MQTSLSELDVQLLLLDVMVVAVHVLLACCCQRVVDVIRIAKGPRCDLEVFDSC